MELNEKSVENGHVALSLISQFCDSKLKEMSNKCATESLVTERPNFLYSDVLASSSIQVEQGNSSNIQSNDFINEINAESLKVHISRKVNLSRHIKTITYAEWLNDDPIDYSNNNGVIDCEINKRLNCTSHINSLAKQRLECYSPILRQRIVNGKWKKLKSAPTLESFVNSCSINVGNNSSSESIRNFSNIIGKCQWDTQQSFLRAPPEESMVFYGMVEKTNSIQPERLTKLYECIGVSSLPLQSMMTSHIETKLNDGTEKIRLNDLSGKLKFSEIVTGVTVAIIGRVIGITLHAEDVVFATPYSVEWPIPKENNIEMVFLSGLNLGNKDGNNLSLDLLQDYLLGLSGSTYEQTTILAPRIRLFIMGNLIGKFIPGSGNDFNQEAEFSQKAMDKLDNFLEPILHVMEVFLIPGENDPTISTTFPNPPIYLKMLPQSQKFPTLKRLANPARVQVSISGSDSTDLPTHPECSLLDSSYADFLKEDVSFIDMLFQSGKNLRQTMDYCDIFCPIEMGIHLLKWGHLHPTYCDTNSVLAQNIFRLHGSLPHVVAIGNLSEFKYVNWNGTKVIGVPAFHKSHIAVTFTKDFNVLPINFKLM